MGQKWGKSGEKWGVPAGFEEDCRDYFFFVELFLKSFSLFLKLPTLFLKDRHFWISGAISGSLQLQPLAWAGFAQNSIIAGCSQSTTFACILLFNIMGIWGLGNKHVWPTG